MFTQLSLFDLPCNFDSASPVVAINSPENADAQAVNRAVENTQATEPVIAAKSLEPVQIYGDSRPADSIQPMGDLARLVLARYEMVARRRQERMRRDAEQPRKSIRVLSHT